MRCKLIACSLVHHEERCAQFSEPCVEQAWIRVRGLLQGAKRHGFTAAQFPEDAQRAPTPQEVKGDHDRAPRATAAYGQPWRWCFTFHSDDV